MSHTLLSRTLLLGVLFFALAAPAQIKLVKSGALVDAKVPESVRRTLEPGGHRVVRGEDTTLAEIWLRQAVPATANANTGALYPGLADSVMVGVMCLPSGGKDFRGQPIKFGCYTMRYELLPQDGNHLGVAPNPDFLLLIPAAADPDPAAKYDFAKLVRLSKQATGSNHPAAFCMAPAEAGEPKAFQNSDGFIIFAGALQLDSGKPLPLALIVKGQAEQ